MIKLDYIVRVYTNSTETDSTIGLTSGVCEWSTANQALGILTDNWISGIKDSVDISVSGYYAQYSNPTIKIVKNANVETVLNNVGLTLTGLRIEVVETDGVDELLLLRGIIQQIRIEGNDMILPVSHVANYYNTQIAPRIGEEYAPVVFGDEVNKVKLNSVLSEPRDSTVGDNLTPVFEVKSNSKTGLVLQSVYSFLDYDDMVAFVQENQFVIAEGENSLVGQISPAVSSFPQIIFYPLPLNAKDNTGTPYLPTGTNVILSGVDYNRYYTPYGSDVDADKLQYKDGDVFYDFPSYVDSRVDRDESIDILDSDNSGESFIPPKGVAQWDSTGTSPTIKPFFGAGISLVDVGVFKTSTLTISNIVYTNPEGIYDRGSGAVIECDITGVGNAYFVASYPIKLTKPIPDNAYLTMDCVLGATNATSTSTMDVIHRAYVETFKETYELVNRRKNSQTTPIQWGLQKNELPLYVNSGSANEYYRWENTIFGDIPGSLGRDIDILEPIENDYEKEVTMVLWVEFFLAIAINPDTLHVKIDLSMSPAAQVEYNASDVYISSEGRKNISDAVVTETNEAYKSVLQLQNYSYLGLSAPSLGWGLEYPSGDLSVAIDPSLSVRSIPLSYQPSSVSTNDIKLELLKFTAGIGYINSSGLESWADALNMYLTTGYAFTKHRIKGRPTIKQMDPKRVYPEIGVTYANGSISVLNVEQDIYSADYVTGVSDPNDAKLLWWAGNLLYKKYKIKNKYPDKLADIKGIKNEADAVDYIKRQYELAGVQFGVETASLYERYNLTFTTTREYVWDAIDSKGSFELGDPVYFTYPNIATLGNGVITGIIPNIRTGDTSVIAEMVGDIIDTNEQTTIIESGTQTDNIVESGAQADNYVEEI